MISLIYPQKCADQYVQEAVVPPSSPGVKAGYLWEYPLVGIPVPQRFSLRMDSALVDLAQQIERRPGL